MSGSLPCVGLTLSRELTGMDRCLRQLAVFRQSFQEIYWRHTQSFELACGELGMKEWILIVVHIKPITVLSIFFSGSSFPARRR